MVGYAVATGRSVPQRLAIDPGAAAGSSIRRAVLHIDVPAAGEFVPLGGADLAKRPRRPSCPDPAGLDDGPGFDPPARRPATAALAGHAIPDPRQHADEAIVAERARAHLYVVSDRHPRADYHRSPRLAG